ncbi:hypothetical protein [Nocardioides zhouii]|uniref:O-antigen ligase family protein n=1 Tax=Nocardioides zhouii TaxID=1168729 RepID=A0A4Q2T3V9_9ACTN|nr:hypothetical protein [Nocardioides zhouii]RYC11528.1 hypothetical protein EUA94_09205 [Nocardioides zhouii]
MAQHALAGISNRPWRAVRDFLAWHDARPRASFVDARGWIWLALVASTFVWMSNPLVFIPTYYLSFNEALVWTKVVLVLMLPFLRVPRLPWPWVAFLTLTLVSHTWSLQPFYTDVSNTVYIKVALMAVLAAANCEPVVVAWGMALGGVSVVVLSLYALHMALPDVQYSAVTGIVFGGVGRNENILAYTLVVSLAATLAIGLPRGRFVQALWVVAILIQLYGLSRADSGMGYLAALIVGITAGLVGLSPLFHTMTRMARVAYAAGALAVLTAGLLFVTLVLGKDLATISGRAPFWKATVESTWVFARWRGEGWGAVWEHPWDPAPPNHVALDIYRRAGVGLSHGHNFFVDVLPELGLLGLLVVLLMVAYAVREVRWCGVREGSADPLAGRLLLLVLVALLSAGVAEPMFTVPLGWWSLALAVSLPRQGMLRILERPRGRGDSRAAVRRTGRRRAQRVR